MKNLCVTVDGDTKAVDSVEEAATLFSTKPPVKTKRSLFTSVTRAKSGSPRSRIPTSTTRPVTTGSGARSALWSIS